MTIHTKNSNICLQFSPQAGHPSDEWKNEQKAGSPQMLKSIPAAEHNLFAIFYSTTRMKTQTFRKTGP